MKCTEDFAVFPDGQDVTTAYSLVHGGGLYPSHHFLFFSFFSFVSLLYIYICRGMLLCFWV
jgi:hypothetical protein